MAQQNTDMLDGLQAAVITESQKQKQDKNVYHFDTLAMYFKEDYFVKGVKIVQPTIGNILDIGESKFYSGLSPLLYNSTSIRVMLWDAGIDWCNVKDIEVFNFLSQLGNCKSESMKLMFPDFSFENFKLRLVIKQDTQEQVLCLYNPITDFIIYENEYMEIAEYIRTLFNVHPKVEKAKGKTAKKWMIEEDRMNMVQRKEEDGSLLSLVSACVNHPGFKYKLQELRDVGIYQFMDSVQRLQVYESSRALLQGSYSGFCDTSKIPLDNFNFMRDMHKNN